MYLFVLCAFKNYQHLYVIAVKNHTFVALDWFLQNTRHIYNRVITNLKFKTLKIIYSCFYYVYIGNDLHFSFKKKKFEKCHRYLIKMLSHELKIFLSYSL